MSSREATDIPTDAWDYIGLPMCGALVAPVGGVVSFDRVRLTPQGQTMLPCLLRIGGTELQLPSGARLLVSPGARVMPGERLASWGIVHQDIVALEDGIVRLHLASPPERWERSVTGDVLVGLRDLPARVDLQVGDEIRQSHLLSAGCRVQADGTPIGRGQILASLEIPRGLCAREPLPSWQELHEHWCTSWRDKSLPLGPDQAALGLIKLAADVPVEGVLQGLPSELSERVRACVAAGLPRESSYLQGSLAHPYAFELAAVQVAETRYALGLQRLREHPRGR